MSTAATQVVKEPKLAVLRCECGNETSVPFRWFATSYVCPACYGKRAK